MTAQERLAAALERVSPEVRSFARVVASDALATDPHLAQDIADGEALRRLRGLRRAA